MGTTQSDLIQASARPNALPGAIIFIALRMFIFRVIGLVFLLAVGTSASRGSCIEGLEGSQCIQLNLAPNPTGPVAAFLLTIWVLGAIVRKCATEAEAINFLRTVLKWSLVVVLAGIAISHLVFWLTPIEGWPGVQYISPFPFANLTTR